MSEFRKISLENIVSDTFNQVESVLDQALLGNSEYESLTPEWQGAIRRWVTNTSITEVLTKRRGITKKEVVDILAKKTIGMDSLSERRVAIDEGVKTTGVMFGRSLVDEVKNRLAARS